MKLISKALACFFCIWFSTVSLGQSSFYNTSSIQSIDISLEQANWSTILDSMRLQGGGFLLATVDINGRKFYDVGVRYVGGRAYQTGSARNSLTLQLNFIRKNQNIEGHTFLYLSNALRDPSMVREVLGFEIARMYMPAPQANYANVRVNNSNYGLLVNVQGPDDAFMMTNYKSSGNPLFFSGDIDENTPDGCRKDIYGSLLKEDKMSCYLHNFKKLSRDGWEELQALTAALADGAETAKKKIDIDETLWMLALNNVLVNLSSYSGNESRNFFLYQDDNGVFHPFIYDMNLAFGSYKNIGGGSDLELDALIKLDPLLHANNITKPLIAQLLKDETNKKIYVSHLRQITQDWFVNGQYLARAKELQKLIRSSFVNDSQAFYNAEEFDGSIVSTTGKKSKIPGISELMEPRTNFLKKHPLLKDLPPAVTEIEVKEREKLSNVKVTEFVIVARTENYTKKAKIIYRLDGKGDWSETWMYDDGKHRDKVANDGVFGISIPPANGATTIEYYIMVENATLVGYSPANYKTETHKASLDVLNN